MKDQPESTTYHLIVATLLFGSPHAVSSPAGAETASDYQIEGYRSNGASTMQVESATNGGTKIDFDAQRPPFDGIELWRKIRTLLDKYDGKVVDQDVESIFEISLKKGRYRDGSGSFMYKKPKTDAWYGQVTLEAGVDNYRVLSIDWKSDAFRPEGQITKQFVMQDLIRSKWRIRSEQNINGVQRDVYCYNGHALYIQISGNTVTGVSFGWTKDEGHEVCI